MRSHQHSRDTPWGGFPAIYQSPTIETLEDGSLIAGRLDLTQAQPNSARTPTRKASPTYASAGRTPSSRHSPLHYTPLKTPSLAMLSPPLVSRHVSSRSTSRQRRRRKRQHDFQIEEDAMHVSVKTVDIAARTVFDPIPPVSLEEWHETVRNAETQKKVSMRKRLSPSLQHLELLHRFQSMHSIRQLNFSSSVGLNSDVLAEVQTRSNGKRDGRYRSIDPLKATRDVLPDTAPLLSNRKLRLPMRCDVGFPNATSQELQIKEKEIRLETQWEEASPRLIVLITSDNLGQAVVDDDLPFAGTELLLAKKRNVQHFRSRNLRTTITANRFSVLAPPLGATHSSTLGWRPRPFYDRPPGMFYCLASPLEVHLNIGDLEPLVCTLTLYSLGQASQGQLFGKISEDFTFPAGHWNNRIDFDAVRREYGGLDPKMFEEWRRRKHKALFGYNPNLLSDGDASLHLVLQVFRPSLSVNVEVSKRTSISKRIKNKLGKLSGTKGGSGLESFGSEAPHSTTSFCGVAENLGTQLLTPIGFGVIPLCPNHTFTGSVDTDGMHHKKMKWPNGSKQLMHIYAFPPVPDDQNQFLERIAAVAAEERNKTSSDDSEVLPEPSVQTTGDFEDTEPMRKGIFNKKRSLRTTLTSRCEEMESLRITGRAFMFASFLGSDFIQAMLTDPEASGVGELKDGNLPRLLVDVSGDCAIAVNPSSADGMSTADGRKRSDLIRLPKTPIPSGYLGASEVQEMMYLPPRFDKRYDVDPPMSLRSAQNVLYIYPRFLKVPSKDLGKLRHKTESTPRFAVRVRLVRFVKEGDEMEVINAMYNPTPWTGSPILDHAFTKLISHSVDKSVLSHDGVVFRDEMKMRLPMIVDGSFHLQFNLFAVDESDVRVQAVSEAIVPLSSSSTREANSGVRVTTVIPNGSHRLKLGECQLQFETRLISSLHVTDPAAAMALRDFPMNLGRNEACRSLALVPSRSVLGKTNLSEPIVDLTIPFHHLFATASDSDLFGSCHLFIFMHMCNLVHHAREEIFVSTLLSGDETMDDNLKFLMDNLQSMFEVLRKVKVALVSRSDANSAELRIQYFVKDFIDNFDENAFTTSLEDESISGARYADGSRGQTALSLERSRSGQTTILLEQGGTAYADIVEDEVEDRETDGGAVHLRAKDSVRAEIEGRLSRTVSKMYITDAPLSRVAYGATKTDRWKAEAEHYQNGARFSHLVDDDETIVTSFTFAGKEGKGEDPPSIMPSATWGGIEDDMGSVVDKPVIPKSKKSDVVEHNAFADSMIAKRVRMAAQTIIAPCMAPSVSGMNDNNSPQNKPYEAPKIGLSGDAKKRKTVFTQEVTSGTTKSTVVVQGSDGENDSGDAQTEGVIRNGGKADPLFRGEASSILLPYSYGHLNTNEAQSRVFAYEPIIALWVKAWIQHRSASEKDKEIAFPPLKMRSEDSVSSINGFFTNMDILLPLCLKSLVLRCSPLLPQSPSTSRIIFDNSHMEILFPFMGVLASCLLGEANSGKDKDDALSKALNSMDTALDFLIGLASILHPQQVAELLQKFLQVMRDAEIFDAHHEKRGVFKWTPDTIHMVRSSRQLRLRVVERFTTIGPYLAVNFPMKFTEWKPGSRQSPLSWTTQFPSTGKSIIDPATSEIGDGGLLPESGWLASLLVNESLIICSLSCEIFITEAIAHIETSQHSTASDSPLQYRPGQSLTKKDLLLFQSIGLHSISCVHELLIRRHAMDSRFQTEQCRCRIASMIVGSVLEKSVSSARWLARMESTHKIRSLWLVSFSYILQEAPESILRTIFREYSGPEGDFAIHRIIRLLRLSSSTFQCLVKESTSGENSLDSSLLPWVLQESFNSICASIILVIDECTSTIMKHPRELKKMAQGTVDLLLQILTVPQSAVTHLRTVGGALQALEKFGVKVFLEVTGDSLQHWIRVIQTLMNSISLSVRSIAVDFAISLIGESFGRRGTIDDIAIIFATVLPEVVAREIGLYSVAGLLREFNDIERVVWPLRRALAEIEDANPLDDDRVDPQLVPVLSVFCRSCQAIIDGALIELKLRKGKLTIVGTPIRIDDDSSNAFDADEESLFEAANFFSAEVSPMQRLRWLNTLKSLHESKGQWLEAAETLMLCATTISDSLPQLRNVWTASEFVLWNDPKRSLWLDTIGQEQGHPDRGNLQVMAFACNFLEPTVMFGEETKRTSSGKLTQPSVQVMCNKLVAVSKESISLFQKEEGNDDLAFSRLESLLRVVMVVVEEHSSLSTNHAYQLQFATRKRLAGEAAALRMASASLNSDMTKLADKMLLLAENEGMNGNIELPQTQNMVTGTKQMLTQKCYVRVCLSGEKPKRFLESTSIPTFLQWDSPCICRVRTADVQAALAGWNFSDTISAADRICIEFGKPLSAALENEKVSVALRIGHHIEDQKVEDDILTYLDISMVHVDISGVDAPWGTQQPEALEFKRFLYRKSSGTVASGFSSRLVELTVARAFPCAISRQRTLITSEFVEGSP